MFGLEKYFGGKSIKPINVKSSIDYHYLKSVALLIAFATISYYYVDKSTEVSNIMVQYDGNIEQVTKLNNDIKNNKKKLEEFNVKIVGVNKIFLKDKEDFGLYKLMEHLDKDAKLFNFKYTTNQKQVNLTKEYFSYDFKFEVPYSSYQSMSKVIDTIEGTYHNTFMEAKFDKGKFILSYKFYGKKGSENVSNKKTKFN